MSMVRLTTHGVTEYQATLPDDTCYRDNRPIAANYQIDRTAEDGQNDFTT